MNNPQAFPRPLSVVRSDVSGDQDGMMLRDYFAAKAMQAYFSRNHIDVEIGSKFAYIIADAMLEERNK